jgi:MSHA biogenesis protein MshK
VFNVKTITVALLGLWVGGVTSVYADVRDPTTPLQSSAVTSPIRAQHAYAVHSILFSSTRKIAVINGHALKEGQTIPQSSVTLLKIHAHAVTLSDGKRSWNVALLPNVRR